MTVPGQNSPEAGAIAIGALRIRYLVDGTVTGAGAGMFELTIPPGAKSPPAHSHDNEEFLYCIEGQMRCFAGDVVRVLAPGDSNYTPPGVVHSFDNPGDETARILVVNKPDIGAQYFRDVAAAVSGPGAPDPAKIAGVMLRYGLRPAVPEPAAGRD
jgi:quercetin dioxygenase-like cupin family protein